MRSTQGLSEGRSALSLANMALAYRNTCTKLRPCCWLALAASAIPSDRCGVRRPKKKEQERRAPGFR